MKLPNGPYALKSLLIVTLLSRFVHGASPTWISLNLSVPSALSDQELNQNFVDVNVGTPPQTLKLAIDVQADSISAYASDCAFCPGDTFFDYKASSTFKFNEERHLRTTNEFDGAWAFDTIGFGGVMQSTDVDLGLLRGISTNYSSIRTWNGDLGLLTNTFRNGTFKRLLADLNSTGQLLNPVLGMRFDPQNPKLTIGALDPNDYVGELNWVQIEDDQLDWFEFNVFKIDGFAGRNGSLLPFGDLTASLDSISSDIAIPDNSTYFNNSDYTGPIFNGTGGINFDPAFHIPSYPCKSNEVVFPGIEIPEAYVDFSVVINGVSYMIDSKDNLLRATSFFSPTGYCNVGISTYQGTTQPKSRLGLPFLRSVYV
ncbi:acid protease [Panus rudis PR-1116 ss-1]|nr:acid protease [Panus rudis PR-1116 ss-1]